MSIPSYDDLTPPIPDVLASDAVPQLAVFLGTKPDPALPSVRQARPTASARQACSTDDGRPARLFACVRGSADADAALSAIARDFSPRVMRVAMGELLIDVSGLGRLIGTPDDIAREVRRAVENAAVGAVAAIAPTQITARILARAPGATAIAGLPIALLRDLETLPPGMNVRDRERPYETLARWGIATLGDVAALPAADLSSRLGRRGVALQRLACGDDPRPFVPDADVPRFIGRLELEWPIAALEPLSFVFARLLDPLAAALERADRGAAALRLDLRLTDRSIDRRVLQLPAPIRDPRVLRTLLLLELESHPPSPCDTCAGDSGGSQGTRDVSVDVVTLEIDPAPSRITQFSLLERAVPSPETVSTLVARLSALVGDTRVGSPRVLDTHQPGAFAMDRFAIAPAAPRAVVASGDDATRRGAACTLRRQRTPPAIRVNVSDGRPVYLAPSRRGIPSGAVVQSAGPWRASGGWWMPDGWNRIEWDVALAGGDVCRLFQDRATGRWFFEGLYD